MRAGLGDWRDSITWPPAIFVDLTARSEFYVGLGFDTELTDLPAPAFLETVTIARLRRKPPALVEAYGTPIARTESDDEEIALVRTNEAHDWLLRLETQLRRFTDRRVSEAYGPDWPGHRLPNDLYEKWARKRQRAEDAGGPLIAYADFTDYELVLCRGDNWREVFVRYSADRRASARPSSGFIRSGSIRCTLGQSRRTMNCCSMSRHGGSRT